MMSNTIFKNNCWLGIQFHIVFQEAPDASLIFRKECYQAQSIVPCHNFRIYLHLLLQFCDKFKITNTTY
ncbi:putative inactive serine/threonine-protein kinase gdt1 [Frankliniella fusca]|uniref:Inactive serine/threonine-protein kinase gdt1 n=1 Tax=Frankliniella fusca TaxID=407009 RepID=A0AAE1HIW3_9NEOP|nr:putative inactive serine/threonine-protein kinase gdt1 [Frankliniella fusca]